MRHKYLIVLKLKPNFVLAACPTKELAEKRLKEMYNIDKELAQYYNWSKLPEYEIREEEVLKHV